MDDGPNDSEFEPFEVPELAPPYSAFTSSPYPVESQLRTGGLRPAVIATPIRRWARARRDVVRIVLGYTGKRYTLGVLLDEDGVQGIAEIFCELRFVEKLVEPVSIERTVLGPEHADAEVFQRYGRYEVYDRATDRRNRAAAA